jgi:hypothetical protein
MGFGADATPQDYIDALLGAQSLLDNRITIALRVKDHADSKRTAPKNRKL